MAEKSVKYPSPRKSKQPRFQSAERRAAAGCWCARGAHLENHEGSRVAAGCHWDSGTGDSLLADPCWILKWSLRPWLSWFLFISPCSQEYFGVSNFKTLVVASDPNDPALSNIDPKLFSYFHSLREVKLRCPTFGDIAQQQISGVAATAIETQMSRHRIQQVLRHGGGKVMDW